MRVGLAFIAASTLASAGQAEIAIQRWPSAGPLPQGASLFGTPAAGTADLSERGQTFTAEHTGKLLSLDLLFSRRNLEDRPDPTFQLSLFNQPGGLELATTTFKAPASLGASLQWVSADFSDSNFFLSAGATRFFRLVEVGTSRNQNVNMNIVWYGAYGPSQSLYSGGAAFQRLNGDCPVCGTWRPYEVEGQDADFAFRLHIDTSATAVPEPATWAMMIGGFGMLGAAARRRTRTAFTYA